jgi:GNAT superfamily N-acetyltransferase
MMNVSIISAYDEYGETDYILGKAAGIIAKQRDLGITRDRVLQFVAMLEDRVVGGAWVSFDGDNYEFDVAVAPGYDRKGIGTTLVRAAISERSEICQGYDETGNESTMLVPVTSRSMCNLLEKEGFIITDVPAKGFYTMGLKDECRPCEKPHQEKPNLYSIQPDYHC